MIEIIGEGWCASVVRDPSQPGTVLKIPHRQEGPRQPREPDPRELLEDEQRKHAALQKFGVRTIPEYTVEQVTQPDGTVRYQSRMTDLTEGGKSFVVNTADLAQLEPDEIDVLAGIVRQRPRNTPPDVFFAQLKEIILNAEAAEETVEAPWFKIKTVDGIGFPTSGGFFMILGADGTLQTLIGDYEDGVSLCMNNTGGYDRKSYRHLLPVEQYITDVVLRFFPEFEDEARKMLAELTNGAFPQELIGERDLAKRAPYELKKEWDRTRPTWTV